MKQPLPERERSDARDAASAEGKAEPLSPMGRFKSLARRLVKVPRKELLERRKREKPGSD